jgi:biopolymer transport protein ExbD
MKFPRNARIFRGQLDAAPIAGVLFLLVFFVLLHSSMVYHPGLRMELKNLQGASSPNAPEQIVKIDSKDHLFYRNTSLNEAAFLQRLREEVAKGKAPKLITVRTEPGTRTELVQRVKILGTELGIPVYIQKIGIDLPDGEDLPGTDAIQVVVAVSHSGQIFFQNQLTDRADLKRDLRQVREKVVTPLALVIDADKAVTHETIMDLAKIARDCAFDEVLLATRPRLSPLPAKASSLP